MAIHEVRNISDVRSVRCPRVGDVRERLLVRCAMLVVQWDDKLSHLRLTDFTKLGDLSAIDVVVRTGGGMEQVRAMVSAYGGVTSFLDEQHLVLVDVKSEVFQEVGTRYKFILQELRVLNSDPMSVFAMGTSAQSKVKELVTKIQGKGLTRRARNSDFQNILGILTRKRDNNTGNSTDKTNDAFKKPKLEHSVTTKSTPLKVNPLFMPPGPMDVNVDVHMNMNVNSNDSINFETQFLETQKPNDNDHDNGPEIEDILSDEFSQSSSQVPHRQRSNFVQVETSTSVDTEPSQRQQDIVVDSPSDNDIGRVLQTEEFALEESFEFAGHVVALVPFECVGQSFHQQQHSVRNFRLLVSQRPLHSGTRAVPNSNCLALDVDAGTAGALLGVAADANVSVNVDEVRWRLAMLRSRQTALTFRVKRRERRVGPVTLTQWTCDSVTCVL